MNSDPVADVNRHVDRLCYLDTDDVRERSWGRNEALHSGPKKFWIRHHVQGIHLSV